MCFWGNQLYMFFQVKAIYLSIQLAGFSYHPRYVSLSPRRVFLSRQWKIYYQVSPWKNFENLAFSLVIQGVPTGVLRQGVIKEKVRGVSISIKLSFLP